MDSEKEPVIAQCLSIRNEELDVFGMKVTIHLHGSNGRFGIPIIEEESLIGLTQYQNPQ